MTLPGNSDETNGYNSVVKAGAKPSAKYIKSMIPPIGSILPWAKSLGGNTPSLPDGWAECDGSVVSDSDSPFNGDTLPNLNSTNSFLMGDTTSGSTGGSNNGTIISTTGFTAGGGKYWETINGLSAAALGTGSYNYDRRPVYYSVVWIIRIK